jgi:hypothetical protein
MARKQLEAARILVGASWLSTKKNPGLHAQQPCDVEYRVINWLRILPVLGFFTSSVVGEQGCQSL